MQPTRESAQLMLTLCRQEYEGNWMFPKKESIKEHYRQVLKTNDKQLVCCNSLYPAQEVPEEIAIHSLSILQPLNHCVIQPGDRILDIGCGAGADCFLAAYRGGPQTRVTGIDFVEELICRAKELKQKHKVSNTDFIHSDVPPLPFKCDSFDIVIMNYSFHLFEHKFRILDEIHRVLVNGGKTVIADSFTPKATKSTVDEESWLMAAGGAITENEFRKYAESSGLIVEEFITEHSEYLPEGEVVGYMVCRK
jgi:arsenite methyltransferase